MCQQCNQLLFEEIKSTVSLIEKERQTYFSFLRNWGTAWHNEQRIIYDIDSPRTIERLQTIHHKQGIKLIIACVHTRLAPCIASESYKSCDCYHCLQNWPEIWLGSQFPSLMTVSYVTYPESSGEQIYSDKQTRQNANSIYKYFIGQYVSSVLKPSGRGKRWLNEELSFYTSHINYFKTNQFSNFFDQALMDAFKPILDVCRVSYIDKALCIQSNQFSVQKRLNTEKTMTLILDDYIEVSMAKLYLDHDEDSENITMEISANDNDWVLLLKSYVLEHRRFKRSSLAPTVSVGVGNPVPDLFQQEPSSINDSKDSLTGSANLGSVILDPNRDLSVPLVKDYTTTDSNRYVFFRNAFIINSLFLVINQFVNSWQK